MAKGVEIIKEISANDGKETILLTIAMKVRKQISSEGVLATMCEAEGEAHAILHEAVVDIIREFVDAGIKSAQGF